MYQLSQFCFCISLRIGTLIIGLLYLIGSTISLAGLVVTISSLYGCSEHHISFYGFTAAQIRAIIENGAGINTATKVISITLLVLCCVQIVIDILLVAGAAREKAELTVPWLVLNVVLLVFNLGGLGAFSCIGFMFYPAGSMASIAPIVLSVIYIAVTVCAMFVVNSFHDYYKKLYNLSIGLTQICPATYI